METKALNYRVIVEKEHSKKGFVASHPKGVIRSHLLSPPLTRLE